MSRIAILGAGSWGLTLAWLTSQAGHRVSLWARSNATIQRLETNRSIAFPVTLTLPDEVYLTTDLAEAVEGADIVILVVTSAGTRSVLEQLSALQALSPSAVLLNASKGIEYPSLKTLSSVVAEYFPHQPSAVLSGPTLAPEILKGLPTAAVAACHDQVIAETLQQALSTDRFRLYTNTDVIGTEMGGSLKNIFAIVSGFMQAKQLGDNAQSTLITRGLAEMTRFSMGMGADVQTLYGLSGLGDLLATCNSPLSRNYQVGYRLAQGQSLETILAQLNMVAEGVKTTYAVCELADLHGLDVPIVRQVRKAFEGDFCEQEIIHTLMSRRLKAESVKTPV
ncbi:MAG: NAD(P)H-dependent glycerol-3-phosphate dehydrogenase [Vampirovibrionales bacterium]